MIKFSKKFEIGASMSAMQTEERVLQRLVISFW